MLQVWNVAEIELQVIIGGSSRVPSCWKHKFVWRCRSTSPFTPLKSPFKTLIFLPQFTKTWWCHQDILFKLVPRHYHFIPTQCSSSIRDNTSVHGTKTTPTSWWKCLLGHLSNLSKLQLLTPDLLSPPAELNAVSVCLLSLGPGIRSLWEL